MLTPLMVWILRASSRASWATKVEALLRVLVKVSLLLRLVTEYILLYISYLYIYKNTDYEYHCR